MRDSITLADSFSTYFNNHETSSIVILVILAIIIALLIWLMPSIVRYVHISRM